MKTLEMDGARAQAELDLIALSKPWAKRERLMRNMRNAFEEFARRKVEIELSLCTQLKEMRDRVAISFPNGVTAWKKAMAGSYLGSVSRIESMLTVGTKALTAPEATKHEAMMFMNETQSRVLDMKRLCSRLAPALPPAGGKNQLATIGVVEEVTIEEKEVGLFELLDALGVEDPKEGLAQIRAFQHKLTGLEEENADLRSKLAQSPNGKKPMNHDWQFDRSTVPGHDIYKCSVCGCTCALGADPDDYEAEFHSMEEMEADDTCPGKGTEDD
jgi:hypothetical protein